MMRRIILTCTLISLSGYADSVAWADMRMWVAAEGPERHTCPSEACGVTGRFFFRESLYVYETQGAWSRVTHFRSAGCNDGVSAYVETGPNECSAENGIVQGKYAEWIKSEFLAKERPEEPIAVNQSES